MHYKRPTAGSSYNNSSVDTVRMNRQQRGGSVKEGLSMRERMANSHAPTRALAGSALRYRFDV